MSTCAPLGERITGPEVWTAEEFPEGKFKIYAGKRMLHLTLEAPVAEPAPFERTRQDLELILSAPQLDAAAKVTAKRLICAAKLLEAAKEMEHACDERKMIGPLPASIDDAWAWIDSAIKEMEACE